MPPKTERRKILIVEDSPTMVKLYRMILGRDPGADLIMAADGFEGLDRAAQEENLSLIVVDINMPRMDGLEFLRRLRDGLETERTPALVVSTEASAECRDLARKAGGDAFLAKPVDPAELSRTVRELMQLDSNE